jgi:GWxTD domain-containing protein
LLELSAVAWHNNDSVTTAYLQIINENVLYKRPDTSQSFYAELRVTYKLLLEQKSRKIIDSSSYLIVDRFGGENVSVKSLVSKFNLRAFAGTNYYLDIEVFDLNRHIRYNKGLNIYKENKFSAQNFLVTRNDSVAFKNNFLKGQRVVIRTAVTNLNELTVDCFTREFGPALPPFSVKPPDELKYRPDSVFKVYLVSGSVTITMPEKGFYHVKAFAGIKQGVSLFTYDLTFPGVASSEEMTSCTRYIMSREEFDKCMGSDDKKSAIDNFWLALGGSNERARELLRRYYGRVKEANKYYTSYTQGWKSDRGMIFIVFGPPTNLRISKKDEIWVYGNESNPSSLRFIFNKTPNPFSDNDFILERSVFYKEAWFTAVDYWRQGQVYLNRR